MSKTLTFNVSEVRRVYEHAKSSSKFRPTWEQMMDPQFYPPGKFLDDSGSPVARDGFPNASLIDESKIPPSIHLVGDRGIYLMSGGSPGDLLDGQHFVAYAKESNPNTDVGWDYAKVDIWGGDDGVEALPLSMFEHIEKVGDDAKVKISISRSKIMVTIEAPKSRVTIKNGMEIETREPLLFKNGLTAKRFRILDTKTGFGEVLDAEPAKAGSQPKLKLVLLSLDSLRDRIRAGTAIILNDNSGAKPRRPKI